MFSVIVGEVLSVIFVSVLMETPTTGQNKQLKEDMNEDRMKMME